MTLPCELRTKQETFNNENKKLELDEKQKHFDQKQAALNSKSADLAAKEQAIK